MRQRINRNGACSRCPEPRVPGQRLCRACATKATRDWRRAARENPEVLVERAKRQAAKLERRRFSEWCARKAAEYAGETKDP